MTKEANKRQLNSLFGDIFFPRTGQGRGHRQFGCAPSPTTAEGGGEGGVAPWDGGGLLM